jgi:hypothetical protein
VVLVCGVGAVVVSYVALLTWDQDRLARMQQSFGARHYFANFASSWPPRGAHDPFLWNTELNPNVVDNGFFPFDTASFTISKLNPSVPIDAWGGTGYVLRSNGSVTRAVPVSRAVGSLPPGGACVDSGGRSSVLPVQLDNTLKAGPLYFGIISFRDSTGFNSSQSGGVTVHFPRGSGEVLTTFPPVSLSSVAWSIAPHNGICLTNVQIVLPQPATGG